MASRAVRQRLAHLRQREHLVDDRPHGSRLEQAADLGELLAARVHEEVFVAHAVALRQAQGLAAEEVEQHGQEGIQSEFTHQAAVRLAGDAHQRAAALEHGEGAVLDLAGLGIEDQVIVADEVLEALRLVIDDGVGAQAARQFHVARADRGGNRQPGMAGELDGEAAHPARAAVDQHLLPGLQAPDLEQRLPGREARQRHRRRLDVREVRRFRGGIRLGHQGELGEGADALLVHAREHRVTRLEARHAGADRLHHAGEIIAEDEREAEGHDHLQHAVADLEVYRVHAGGMHLHQQFARPRLRHRLLAQFHDIVATVAADEGGFHLASRNSLTTATCASSRNIGACPTPGISAIRAFGPRCPISMQVACESRSDSAPRTTCVGQRMAS